MTQNRAAGPLSEMQDSFERPSHSNPANKHSLMLDEERTERIKELCWAIGNTSRLMAGFINNTGVDGLTLGMEETFGLCEQLRQFARHSDSIVSLVNDGEEIAMKLNHVAAEDGK